ncbi:MAG: glycosyltransferase [Bryobacteraceae bacterium]
MRCAGATPVEWAAAIAVATWVYLLMGRGFFWWMREAKLPDAPPPPRRVAVVIPARNEAGVVGRAVASIVAQRYPGPFEIFLVDDHSTDATAAVAQQAGARVLAAGPLPEGWTGKLWALSEGLREAAGSKPDYFLLTDADIVHAPGNLARLVALTEAHGYYLASLMVRLRSETVAEKALIPAFVFFFLKLYPPRWIASGRHATAGAAGGCVLIRREALERCGGIEAIRGALIDDCALARAVKRSGGRLWMGLSSATHSIREYGTFGEIGRMIARSAFTQLDYSPLRLAGTVAGMLAMYAFPPALALGFGSKLAALAWLTMLAAYLPVLRLYRLSPLWALGLPLTALFYTGATVWSALNYWRGRGGAWKGRAQARRSN